MVATFVIMTTGQGYHVVFDVANNRVGFGDLKSCPRPD